MARPTLRLTLADAADFRRLDGLLLKRERGAGYRQLQHSETYFDGLRNEMRAQGDAIRVRQILRLTDRHMHDQITNHNARWQIGTVKSRVNEYVDKDIATTLITNCRDASKWKHLHPLLSRVVDLHALSGLKEIGNLQVVRSTFAFESGFAEIDQVMYPFGTKVEIKVDQRGGPEFLRLLRNAGIVFDESGTAMDFVDGVKEFDQLMRKSSINL